MSPEAAEPQFSTGRQARYRIRTSTYVSLGLLFAAFVFATHASLVSMPYFWDEVGQFIPSTWDLYRDGSIVPHSATPNVHPPGVMAWIAFWWKAFWPSVAVTRLAMLLLASLTLLAAFLLAVELSCATPGLPAFFTVLALGVAPIFFTQSLLAQLDLPATLFTCLAFWLFLRERHSLAVLACCALVLAKETGVLLPLVLMGWLVHEKRLRRASFYFIPVALLGLWLLILYAKTGNVLGNPEFAKYNAGSAFRISHVGYSFFRRVFFLFIDHFHLVGTAALYATWRGGFFERRRWRIALTFCAGQILLVSFLGGAVLERYMLPVLPFFYAAAVLGLFSLRPTLKWAGYGALIAGLVAGLFVNPLFWPFPYENNLAVADFTALHARTAEWLEKNAPKRIIATAWPLSAELTQPDLGYVSAKLPVLEIPDFSDGQVASLPAGAIDVFVLYSRDWDPPMNLLRTRAGGFVGRNFLSYRAPVAAEQIQSRFKMQPAAAFRQGGQWVEIYARHLPATQAPPDSETAISKP